MDSEIFLGQLMIAMLAWHFLKPVLEARVMTLCNKNNLTPARERESMVKGLSQGDIAAFVSRLEGVVPALSTPAHYPKHRFYGQD